MNENLPALRKKALSLPLTPGVYLMKDKQGKIIYIGKAKALKNRVSQYFQPNNPSHTQKVRQMVEHVANFDYIMVDSEFEALVLECSLIKQHTPKYNILLKDDKGYHYIRISKEAYPRITAVKQLQADDAEYLGPYTSSYTASQTADEVNRIFGLPTCRRSFPAEFRKGRPCLNYHIKRCAGICRGKITQEEYAKRIGEAKAYIKKGSAAMGERLTREMEQASERLEFEKAAVLRDRLAAIRRVADNQKVYHIAEEEQDVVAFAQNGDSVCVVILKFRNHRLSDKDEAHYRNVEDIAAFRSEFLCPYYLQSGDVPRLIAVDCDFEGREVLAAGLSERLSHKVEIVVPERGEKRRTVEMAFENASEKLSKRVERTGREIAALAELTKLLGLPETPKRIEAYDISNLGGTGKVGGMVVFENGRPLKSDYRRFKIDDIEGQDDYSCMKEMLSRRFAHYLSGEETGGSFQKKPDLILLDGGRGHVAAILPLLAQMGIDVPVFGMVKDSRHRTRAIAKDGGEIAISGCRSAFDFVTGVQDEVHRYAIRYQRTVRKKTAFEVTLTRVEGVGDKKAAAILKAFPSRAALKEASPEQLRKVAKLSLEKAQRLYDFIQAL